MATEVGSAYVSLIPSAKGFGAKMQRELGGEIGRAGDATGKQYGDKFSSTAESGIKGKSKRIFSGLAKGGAVVAAAAGAVVGKVLFDSINAASDLDETITKAGEIFGQQAVPELERYADTAARSLGQSKQQALDAAATFATFGKSAGLAGDDLVSFSTDFTTLASDLASFNNTEPEEAITAIGAALRGETEPMRRYGVLLDDASMRAEAMRLGLVKTTKQALTPQQKVLAAQALIYKQTEDAQGDFARTSDGLANQQRILTAQWEDAKTKIGRGLLPVVTKLLTWANDMMPKLEGVGRAVADVVGPAFDDVQRIVGDLFGSFTGGGDAMSGTAETVRNALDDIKAAVQGVVDVITAIWAEFGDEIMTLVRSAFERVRDTISGVLQVIRGIIDVVMGLIRGDWGRVWDGIKSIVSGVFTIIKAVIKAALTQARVIISVALTLVRGIFARAWDGIKTLTSKALSALVKLIKSLPGKALGALRGLGKALGSLFSAAWSNAKSAVSKGVTNVVNAVKAAPGKLRDLVGKFRDAGKAIIGGLLNGLSKAGGFVSDLVGNVWSAIKGFINTQVLAKLDSALSFKVDWPGPGSFSFNPSIPRLASGGRAYGETLAVIGDGAEPETVLPDSMLRGLLERTAENARSAGSMVGQLTITNWREGTGYFRLLADESIRDEAAFRRDLGAMHA